MKTFPDRIQRRIATCIKVLLIRKLLQIFTAPENVGESFHLYHLACVCQTPLLPTHFLCIQAVFG